MTVGSDGTAGVTAMRIDDRKAPQVPRTRTYRQGPRSSAALPCCGRSAARPQGAGAEPPDSTEVELTVTVTDLPCGTPVARVAGEIDLRTAQLLRSRLIEIGRELTATGVLRLVVDFADVAFCDASGLGALVGAHNDLRARGGELALARVRPAQRRLFQVTGLDRLFGLYDTVAEAVGPRRTSFTG